MADVTQPNKLLPFLMFQKGDAEEAMTRYTELFDDGRILSVERFGADEPNAGKIRQGLFTVAGQQIQVLDSPGQARLRLHAVGVAVRPLRIHAGAAAALGFPQRGRGRPDAAG